MNEICWIDPHCHPHLIVDELDSDLDAIKEAVDAGTRMMCVSVDLSNYAKLAEYKRIYPEYVKFSLGQHPLHETDSVDWAEFANLVANDKNILAIGETGFDFQGSLDRQIYSFRQQAEIACKHDLPIILHTRDAGDGSIEQVTRDEITNIAKIHKNLFGVFHCFTGSIDLAEFALENGWYISFSGIITFNNAKNLRETALKLFKNHGLDKLLIETDSPYLAPQPVRGKVNKPSYVAYIGEFMADLLSVNRKDFAKQIEQNFDVLFKERAKVLL